MSFDAVGTPCAKRSITLLVCGSVLALLGTSPALAQDAGATGDKPVHHAHVTHHHHAGTAARTVTPTQAGASAHEPRTTSQDTAAVNGTAGKPSSAAGSPAVSGANPAKTEAPTAGNAGPPNNAGHEASNAPNGSGNAAGTSRRTAANSTAPAAAASAKSPLEAAVAETFVGQPIYGANGKKIGDLSKVETGPDGKVKSAIISWGGILGYFQSSRTISWAPADPVIKNGKLVLNAMTGNQVHNNEQPQASR